MDITKKRVLVTGGDGFIGSHLVETLLQHGCRVRTLAQYNSFNFLGHLEDVGKAENLEIVTGSICDPDCCEALCKDVDTVFHLAALIAIPYSYRAPESYLDTNIRGTLNICRAAQQAQVKRILVTSTSEVYGSALYVPIDEKHPLQPQSPYSASKIGADAMAMSFYYSFGLPLTVVRPFNTYGPRQSARAIIPTIISQIAAGAEEIMVGDLSPTRDFNYVLDICAGFIALAECDRAVGETVNICTGREISMEKLFFTIRELMGSEVHFKIDPARLRPEKSEVKRLLGDNRKLTELTNFQPKYSLECGLQQTIDWFSRPENLRRYKTDCYNQ